MGYVDQVPHPANVVWTRCWTQHDWQDNIGIQPKPPQVRTGPSSLRRRIVGPKWICPGDFDPLTWKRSEQPVTTELCRPLSALEVQALHRRVLAARDLDVDPDPTDLATVHRINADELVQFDRRLGT